MTLCFQEGSLKGRGEQPLFFMNLFGEFAMTRRLITLSALGALICLITSQQATAFGFLKKHHSGSPSPCDCAPGCTTSYTVSYVDKKVTAYKAESEIKDVKVTVNELVDEKVDYKYIVCEPVTTKSKVIVQELISITTG